MSETAPSGRASPVAGDADELSDFIEDASVGHAAAAARAQRLLRITAAIADAVTPSQVFDALVDQVASVVRASSAGLWLLDEDAGLLRLARGVGYDAAARERIEVMALRQQPSMPALDALNAGEPLFIGSRQQLMARYPHLTGMVTVDGVYRVACLPLVVQGKALGVLALSVRVEAELDEERDFLRLVARYAGQALARLRLFEAERLSRAEADKAAVRLTVLSQENAEARSRAEQLYRLAQAVVTADRVEDVFEAALDALGRALMTDRAAVLVADDEGVMRFRGWRGLSDEYRRTVEGHSPWRPGDAAAQPVLVHDVRADPSLAGLVPLFEREGVGALAFIPLVTRGALLGKFMVYYRGPHRFTMQEVELATAMANLVGSVIARFNAIARLEESIRENELFTGVLAHDLKNPLSAMMTAAQVAMVRQEAAGERVLKPLGRILSSGARMARMIDQLLDLARARSGGGIEIEPRESSLAELCAQAVGELEVTYPDWSVRTDVSGDLRGSWDPDRLLQVLSNLVANAGLHGHAEGGIQIELDGTRADAVCFAVRNQGAIPPTLMPRLFDPFRGTLHRRGRSVRGLGLGLYIVRAIVRAHRGTVEVTSSTEAGTCFTVELPRRPA